MKSFVFFVLLLLSGIVCTGKSYKAEIFKHDGEHFECFANMPEVDDSKIKFKMNEDGKTQKIKSSDIHKIVFYLDDGALEIEYVTYIDWYDAGKDDPKPEKQPRWMQIVTRGPVTLYTYTAVVNRYDKTAYYFCQRANEKAAINLATILNSKRQGFIISKFKKVGAAYFSDNSTISEKIKNKEEGYREVNIVSIVIEYNKVIAQ